VKSAIIFAALYADGQTEIIEKSQTRDHTERMLGIATKKENGNSIVSIDPHLTITGKNFYVPGDISAAAFFLCAGMIVPGSEILIPNVGLNPTRKRIVDIFKSLGGNIKIENERKIEGEPIGDISVQYSALKGNLDLQGSEVVELIDEIPILSVAAMFSEGSFRIHQARELRTKETDRIAALVHNLSALGLDVDEYEDGFAFESKKDYTGVNLPSYGDHRIAMAFGIAGLRIPGICINDAECVDISFPGFWQELLQTRK